MNELIMITYSKYIIVFGLIIILISIINFELKNELKAEEKLYLIGEIKDIKNNFNKSSILLNTNISIKLDEKLNYFYNNKKIEITGDFNCINKKFEIETMDIYSSH